MEFFIMTLQKDFQKIRFLLLSKVCSQKFTNQTLVIHLTKNWVPLHTCKND